MARPKFANADQLLEFLGELEERILTMESELAMFKKRQKAVRKGFLDDLFEQKSGAKENGDE